MSEQYVAEFIANTDGRLILGMFGSGMIFAWISELVFSCIRLLCEFLSKKIHNRNKLDKEQNINV